MVPQHYFGQSFDYRTQRTRPKRKKSLDGPHVHASNDFREIFRKYQISELDLAFILTKFKKNCSSVLVDIARTFETTLGRQMLVMQDRVFLTKSGSYALGIMLSPAILA